MSRKTSIKVDITVNEISRLLSKNLKSADSDKIANVIVNCLADTSCGLALTYKALSGVFPETDVKVGDIWYVEYNYLATWRFDRDATLALPSVYENAYIPVRIESIDLYTESPFKVRYKIIMAGSTSAEAWDTYNIPENYLHRKIEQVEDLLDALERIEEDDEI